MSPEEVNRLAAERMAQVRPGGLTDEAMRSMLEVVPGQRTRELVDAGTAENLLRTAPWGAAQVREGMIDAVTGEPLVPREVTDSLPDTDHTGTRGLARWIKRK